MTTLRTAAQQALDFIVATNKSSQFWLVPESNLNKTVTALRAALAQQDKPVQEPVAWLYEEGADSTLHWNKPPLYGTPLYTAPPQRKPLTEEEIRRICDAHWSLRQLARAIERAHGIKE